MLVLFSVVRQDEHGPRAVCLPRFNVEDKFFVILEGRVAPHGPAAYVEGGAVLDHRQEVRAEAVASHYVGAHVDQGHKPRAGARRNKLEAVEHQVFRLLVGPEEGQAFLVRCAADLFKVLDIGLH